MKIGNLNLGKKVAFVYLAFIILILIITAIIINTKDNGINNYNKYLSNLPNNTRSSINSGLYNIVKWNSTSDKIDTSDAKIRDGSTIYNQDSSTKIYSGSLIVDLEKNKQSYQVFFRWTDSSSVSISGDTVNIVCLPKEKLIYGDFNCKDSTSDYQDYINKNPILNYLPHYTDNYAVKANIDGDRVIGLNVSIVLYGVDIKENSKEEAVNKYKLEFNNWLKSLNLNTDKYIINYTVNI